MLILGIKPGHDGTLAVINNEKLTFSLEAEKDSFPRYESVTPDLFLRALQMLRRPPDALAFSGWVKGWHSVDPPLGAGYFGVEPAAPQEDVRILGHWIKSFHSTHERSHIFSAYGTSPFEQGEPCYCLVWEGNIGNFYEIDERLNVADLGRVVEDPGNKYAFLYFLADPTFPSLKGYYRFDGAGKLMALAGYHDGTPVSLPQREVIDFVMSRSSILLSTSKAELAHTPFYNIGVGNQDFKNLAAHFSNELFGRFLSFAKCNLTKGYPLLIAGGCGLNCEWNTRWCETSLFRDVFVPPFPNDSGSAIGAAVEAQFALTGKAKVDWSVYAGESFVLDLEPIAFTRRPLVHADVASLLADGSVVAWVNGRYEIGPRALGNRSILAAPFAKETRDRLNEIKKREDYRPIAPVCMAEDLELHFAAGRPSPHMLYFQRVTDSRLAAVTHVDGTARVQTVALQDQASLYALLREFKRITGVGVLCNTSLNFSGRGFINRMSDLSRYCIDNNIDDFVVDAHLYQRRRD